MKSEIVIKIETPDNLEVFPNEGESDEDYKTKEQKEYLKDFREEFSKTLHKEVVKAVKDALDVDNIEDDFINFGCEECAVEGFESFDDYGVHVTIE